MRLKTNFFNFKQASTKKQWETPLLFTASNGQEKTEWLWEEDCEWLSSEEGLFYPLLYSPQLHIPFHPLEPPGTPDVGI